MAELLGELLVKIVGDTTGLTKSLSESEKKTLAFSVNVAAATVAVSKMIGVVVNATKEYISYGSAINDISERTGLSTEATQKWKFIAEQTGATIGDVSTAVAAMTRNLGTNADTFKSLGIQVKNADGTFRSTTDIFDDTIRVLSSMQDETERDQLAFKLLGRSAQSIIPILNSGSKEIELMGKQAKNLGIILGDDVIKNADKLGDSTDALKSSLSSAKNVIVNEMAPALIAITDGFRKMIEGMLQSKKEIEALRQASQRQVTDLDTNSLALARLTKEQNELKNAMVNLGPGYKAQEAQLKEQIKNNERLISSLKLQRDELLLIEKQKAKDIISTQKQAEAAGKKFVAEEKAKEEREKATKALEEYNKKQKEIQEGYEAEYEAQLKASEAYDNASNDRVALNIRLRDEFANSQKSTTQIELEEIEKRRQAFIAAGISEVDANKSAQSQILQTYIGVGQTIVSTLQGVFSQIQSLYNQDAQNRIDAINYALESDLQAIDARMQAELEAAGLSEATTIESLQKKLDAALAQGELVTAEELRQEIAKAEIKEKYEKEKEDREKKAALATYKVQLEQFRVNQKLSRAQAVIDTASAALKTATSVPWPFNLPLIAAMVALGAKQIDIINDQVPPSPPALAKGGEVGANSPTLAVIGDNTRYNEVVAPLSPDTFAKIADGILVALASRARPSGVTESTAGSSSMYSGSSNGAGVTVNAGVIVANDAGLRAFARVITPYLQAESVRIG